MGEALAHPEPDGTSPPLFGSWDIVVWTGLFSVVVCHHLWDIYNTAFFSDEIEHLHATWMVLQGKSPYFDFWEHHHPLYWWILAPLLSLVGERVEMLFVARAFCGLWMAAGFFFTHRLAARMLGRDRALWAVLIMACVFTITRTATLSRPDVPMWTLEIWALERLYAFFDERKDGQLIFSGLLLGLAFLFLQKAIFVLAPLGLLLTYKVVRGELTLKAPIVFGLAFLAPGLPLFVWLLMNGGLEVYWICNWWLNLNLEINAPVHEVFWGSFRRDHMGWLLAAVGLFVLGKNARTKDRHGHLLFFVAFQIGLLIVLPVPMPHYFLPLLPLLGLCGAEAAAHFPRWLARAAMAYLVVLLFVGDAIVPLPDNRQQRGELATVLHLTDKDDRVFSLFGDLNLFRTDMDYWWFSHGDGDLMETWAGAVGRERKILDQISRVKPKLVSIYPEKALEHPDFRASYVDTGVTVGPPDRRARLFVRSGAAPDAVDNPFSLAIPLHLEAWRRR
jgi:hypothetical protein